MKNKQILVFSLYLFVNFFSTKAQSGEMADMNAILEMSGKSDCSQRQQYYESVKKDLAEKCGGRSAKGCYEAAKQCNREELDDEEVSASGSSPLMGGLGSGLMGMAGSLIGGGMASSMVSIPDGETFRCLPKSSREQIKKDLEKMRDDAKKSSEEAQKYKREIEKEASDIRKSNSELKKEFATKLGEARKSGITLAADKQKAREDSASKASQILEQLDKNETTKVAMLGQQEETQAQLQALYPETVGSCADKMTASKNAVVNQFFELKQKQQAEIDAKSDLRDKEALRQQYSKALALREKLFKDQLRAEYDSCLRAQTRVYQAGYKKLQNTLKMISANISSLTSKNEQLNQQLKQIPSELSQTLKGLQQTSEADTQQRLSELQLADQEIKEAVSDYQSRYQQAQTDYLQKQQSLNSLQMQWQNNQAIFQMNAIGDAVPLIDLVEDAQVRMCDACRAQSESGKGSGFRNRSWTHSCPTDGSDSEQVR